MKRRQRVALGLTVINCVRVARDLHAEGRLSSDAEEAADQVVAMIAAEYLGEWRKCTGPDWDAIAKWITEVLIPLLLALIEAFSKFS